MMKLEMHGYSQKSSLVLEIASPSRGQLPAFFWGTLKLTENGEGQNTFIFSKLLCNYNVEDFVQEMSFGSFWDIRLKAGSYDKSKLG